MNPRIAALVGGVALAGAALYRLTRRGAAAPQPVPTPPDPRADELRRKLAESREVVGEQEEFESAETTIDAVEDVEERRREIHERGHAAAEQMRGDETAS